MSTIQRSYVFRVEPTVVQREQLNRYFGAARWYWNQSLAIRQKAYSQGGVTLTGTDLSRRLTCWKRAAPFAWLREILSTALTQKGRDLDTAYKNFFAGRARFPRFKKRSHVESIRFQLDQRVVARMYYPGELLKLPGLGALTLRWSRLPAGVPNMVTVRRDALGRYSVSFMVEEAAPAAPQTISEVGIDRGLKDWAVLSDG